MQYNFSKIKVLIIGDFMLDRYIMGKSNRISPEAPVPVVIPESEKLIPGGAGNVAVNIASLGANVTCLGNIGDDKWGRVLIKLLNQYKINTDGIETIKNHITTVKQRIYSNNIQVARLDFENKYLWSPKKYALKKIKMDYDLIIISDYDKGVIDNKNFSIKKLKEYFKSNKKIDVIVDPKKNNFGVYKGGNIVTPNLSELKKASKITNFSNKTIIQASKKLIKKHGFDYIISKKGSRGLSVIGKNNLVINIPPEKVLNADVTGAGDTVISVLSLIYNLTKDIELAAKLANKAAANVIKKIGTASIRKNEV
tara:strand:- start:25837 stop:26766 length:930 start_codon:yes stop_codon:yes gene_type:complete